MVALEPSSQYNIGSAQRGAAFSIGKSMGRPNMQQSKENSDSFADDSREAMLWSPLPMDLDAPSSTGGFSIGREVGVTGNSGARRGQRDALTIPNVPILGRRCGSREQRVNELRRKGNHAFKMKDYEAACAKYSDAIIASLSSPMSERPQATGGLPLLYCNRAAAYLALGKPEEALSDCKAGMRENPANHKCRFRASTCFIRMGRFTEAREVLKAIDSSSRGDERDSEDHIISEVVKRTREIDAAEESFVAYMEALRAGKFPTLESVKVACAAVEAAVPHAEALVASLVAANIQFGDFSGADKILDVVFNRRGGGGNPPVWAGWCRVQTCFFKADYLQCSRNLEALNGLLKRARSSSNDVSNVLGVSQVLSLPDKESLASIWQGIRSVQGLKDQAQAHMKRREFEQAIETYTSALSGPFLSPAMAAILFSNRAAAYQSIGQRALALAECCRAVAISPHFAKPHSRMAVVLTDLGLFLDAQKSIERAITCAADASQRNAYLSMARGIVHHRQQHVDHHLLLGLPPGASATEAKKAYRKLALKLHPDKTSQAMKVDYQLGSSGCRVGTAEETQRQMLDRATWLFKLLGEAQDALV